ncbi:MAG: hypothetical protein H7328_03840 [Bdellovibrio sp.]|nr:hypothetical protein [Bdellovibrio sp.]
MKNSIFVNHKKSLGVGLALALLVFGFFNKELIIGFLKKENSGVQLAKVTLVKNEVRKKKTASLNWNSAGVDDSIHRGDSVSTGNASTALVQFNNGEKLTMDQNTLIVFDQQADTPEFVTGNIKLSVNGSMKIKINNEIVTINGKNADIQVFKDSKSSKQKIVLLKGESKVSTNKNSVNLEPNKVIDSKEVTLNPSEFQAVVAEEKLQETILVAQEKAQTAALAEQALPSQIAAVQPEVPKVYNYKLYDFYKKASLEGLEFTVNKAFVEKPNGQFEIFSTSLLQYKSQIEISGDKPTMAQFIITDSVRPIGYVIELSQTPVFSEETTRYFWARSKFKYPFEKTGTYYLRYRKVLADQHLTSYSPAEKFNISQNINLKLSEIKKQKRKELRLIAAQRKTEAERLLALKKAEPAIKLTDVPRKPAALQDAQSVLRLTPEKALRNLKFASSYVEANVTQGYLASNRQLENNRGYSQSYNLGFDIAHWNYNQGIKAQVSKSMVSSSSANSVLLAELDYMYRSLVTARFADGGQIQVAGIVGYEFYQNSGNTSDFVNSYSMFKLGLGASLPLFSFWNAELDAMYGIGTSKATSLQVNARLSYYLQQNLSLGLGFKARKYDFVLLDQKNMESFAETYTSLRYHY